MSRNFEADEESPRGSLGRLLHSLAGIANTLLAILQTRMELLGVDIQTATREAAALLLWSLAAVLIGGMGFIFLAMTLLIVYWDTHRILVAVLATSGFLGFALLAAMIVVRRLKKLPHLFAGTLDELARDRDQLQRR